MLPTPHVDLMPMISLFFTDSDDDDDDVAAVHFSTVDVPIFLRCPCELEHGRRNAMFPSSVIPRDVTDEELSVKRLTVSPAMPSRV